VIWTVAKKELRGYFNSAVAVIFLAAFLAVTLVTFFWVDKFFARGLTDLRLLFERMPLLMIIVVSALAMRMWSDERRVGTLEVLLTLPVPRWKLVLGKFVAGMLLIAIALGLTLELPITIARMGNLDWGPVFGGYLATLLLAAAYLVIGMCISSATEEGVGAFLGTAFVCAVLYALGFIQSPWAQALSTGARFESVARGVLDLRDLAYYASIVGVGIAVNVLLLGRISWGSGSRTRDRRRGALLALGLVIANAVVLNIWLHPVHRARLDITEDGAYSLSKSTRNIIDGLDEKLLIRGYFSDKTHPKLAPLVPQLRDLLDEYRAAGDGKIKVEVVDPTDSDEAKREAKERFDISPTPLRFATATEKSVVDAYFTIAISYGDQHAVIGLDDLIQVRSTDIGDIEISLKNPEYAITKAIKKAASSFSSIDALFASMPGVVTLTTYMTPKTLPENWKDAPAKLDKAVAELKKQAGGKLTVNTVEPQGEAQMRDLFNRFGLRPYQDLMSGQIYYFSLVLQIGNRLVRVAPPEQLSDEGLKNALVDALKRGAPGFTRVVGLWSPPQAPPMPPMGEGMPPQQMPPPQQFQQIQRALSGNYEVREVSLGARIPDDIEVLVLGGPANLTPKEAEAVDQFVMRGGALVALAGHYRLAPGMGGGLAVEKVTTGIENMLDKWGIKLGDEMVMDKKSDTLPVPEMRDLGNGMMVREIHQIPYPMFAKVDGDQLSSSIITSGLSGSVMHWASPVTAAAKVGDDQHEVDELMRSSGDAWLTTASDAQPNFQKYPDIGFAGPTEKDKQGAQVLAVAVTGGFQSSVPKPAKDAPKPEGDQGKTEPLLEHSPPGTRVVVFGSSAFASDDILGLAQQLDSDLALQNVNLVHNAVDWALADTDLLAIRAHTLGARAITTPADNRNFWRNLNIVLAFVGLGLVVGFSWFRRRSVVPVIAGEEA
jgi:gliding motility-associated transport system permease protein/gliding motility-associatede transport system auxiliary component